MTIRPLGDSALILAELEASPAAIASALAEMQNVRDAVASYETVGVYFEAKTVNVDAVQAFLQSCFAVNDLPLPPGSLADSLTDLPRGGERFESRDIRGSHAGIHTVRTPGHDSAAPGRTSSPNPLPPGEFSIFDFRFSIEGIRTESQSQVAKEGELIGSVRSNEHEIPVCYELGLDLAECAQTLNLTTEELIQIHLSQTYDCFAVGFTPGFPYLGYLPERIATLPRKKEPRTRVEKGSIGITGKQTGVYPDDVPGGWNLIGQTPLEIVNIKDGYFPLEAGDKVRFIRITQKEFEEMKGRRL
ncbi:MAG TPA: carboxyltransferase domain-containing protein [Fimbriimonadaceae bacterium]|jgi:KipI family sensor histidine kinase inhibitor